MKIKLPITEKSLDKLWKRLAHKIKWTVLIGSPILFIYGIQTPEFQSFACGREEATCCVGDLWRGKSHHFNRYNQRRFAIHLVHVSALVSQPERLNGHLGSCSSNSPEWPIGL